MSHYTQQQRAERCVLPLEQAVYQTIKNELGSAGKITDNQIRKVLATAEAVKDGKK